MPSTLWAGETELQVSVKSLSYRENIGTMLKTQFCSSISSSYVTKCLTERLDITNLANYSNHINQLACKYDFGLHQKVSEWNVSSTAETRSSYTVNLSMMSLSCHQLKDRQ